MSKGQRKWLGLLLSVALGLYLTSPTFADNLVSPHYQFSESTLGQNGLPNSASTNYQGSASAGDLGVGESSGTNFQFQGGSQTTSDPRLSVAVNTSGVAFNQFSSSTPSMGTATFSVLNYTSYGYIVLITGGAPVSGGHTLQPMATAGTSSAGFEQYGINLVANTSPQSIGANPNQGQFGFGVAASGYNTTNNYKYVDGDTIARAPKSSGQTDFTISFLANVSTLTPGGQYTSNQSLVVIGTY